ncbi:D-alanyl-D-alanine carboxypeptidase family protein [uncultured Catenibacterium sp.]|uniref:D-alanyl-D-alanine carboxypeptidase family protein n=1 Tax=uncultured Catenibacterium sp. TaxID=286142 RepID=UPI00260090B4|nr:D-alanyl-D-alanine carboxypeptidase family protein [uncultured Catenibacterium sp.]
MRFITAFFHLFYIISLCIKFAFYNNTKCEFYQSQGYDRKTSEKKASQWVSKPGTSEYQLGLSVDLVSYEYQLLDKRQEERIWVNTTLSYV